MKYYFRKKAEEPLRQQEEFNRILLENHFDGIIACDSNMKLILFNNTAREWQGVDIRDIPPQEWSSYYDLYDAEGVTILSTEQIPLVRAFNGELINQVGMTIKAKNQKMRYVNASGGAF